MKNIKIVPKKIYVKRKIGVDRMSRKAFYTYLVAVATDSTLECTFSEVYRSKDRSSHLDLAEKMSIDRKLPVEYTFDINDNEPPRLRRVQEA